MAKLNSAILAKTYTLTEIDAQIVIYTALVAEAAGNKRYSLGTVQNNQSVETQSLSELTELLNSWLEAKAILTGADSGAKFYNVNILRS